MPTAPIPRTPPTAVRRALRQEVGFGCPVEGCANPYLEYHHFDPPWSVENHHDPTRMIALCATHHAKADAWTVDQVRELKAQGILRAKAVQGRFEWMREDVLAVIGGNYYYETPNMVVFRGKPLIWFERDDKNRILLNLDMPTTSGEPRTRLVHNDWIIQGNPSDVESPPSGSSLRVRYGNGDDVSVRFREWADPRGLGAEHPVALRLGSELRFPLITAEITLQIGGTGISFGPRTTSLGGITMTDCVMSRCGAGLAFG